MTHYYACVYKRHGKDRTPYRIVSGMDAARALALLFGEEADWLSAGNARRAARRRDPCRPPLAIPAHIKPTRMIRHRNGHVTKKS